MQVCKERYPENVFLLLLIFKFVDIFFFLIGDFCPPSVHGVRPVKRDACKHVPDVDIFTTWCAAVFTEDIQSSGVLWCTGD